MASLPHTTGVIVGRFQAPRLTPGHVHLINTALLQNDQVILLLGCSPLKYSPKQTIPFEWRVSMIQSDSRLFTAGRKLIILRADDRGDDSVWVESVQRQIRDTIIAQGAASTIRLYGSRDSSFLKAFAGFYEHVELLPFSEFSASELREQIAKQYPSGRESDDKIREGMIMAAMGKYPMVVSTVDVAIFQRLKGDIGIWLGRKAGCDSFRFFGGYAETTSENDEEDVVREAWEESNFVVGRVSYIGNAKIDDWRYAGEKDSIRTRLFASEVSMGEGKAKDDIAAIQWFNLMDVSPTMIVKEHHVLLHKLREWVNSAEGSLYLTKLRSER